MKTVWLGRGISNNVGLIEGLQKIGFKVVLSHNVDYWAGSEYAPYFIEPDIKGQDYVNWTKCKLEVNHFDYFIPGRCLGDFHTFPLKDNLIMGCPIETCNDLDDKGIFYSKGKDGGFDFFADFALFNDLESFSKAKNKLNELGHINLCFKPTKGIFGRGFRILTNKNPLETISKGRANEIRYSDFENWLSEFGSMEEMVLMPTFNGKEVSVDCTFDGENYRMVARTKDGTYGQTIITDEELYNNALLVAKKFQLRGIFNIQFMLHNNKAMMLEINPRPAGGFGSSLFANIDLLVPSIFNNNPIPENIGVIKPTKEQHIIVEKRQYIK